MDESLFQEAEPLPKAIERIIQTRLINHSKDLLPDFNIDGVYFSKQEIKCLRLLVLGKSSKSIGQALMLSSRTVEHYLVNIKQKLQIRTNSELIEKIVQRLWPEIIS